VLADRSGNISQIVYSAATNADALHAAGEFEKAADLFAEAERRWQELQAECPLLYSVQGYGYCDLLQSLGRAGAVRYRATQTLQWARTQHFPLDMALETLSLSRSSLVLTLESLAGRRSAQTECEDARAAACDIDEAVEGLRTSGENVLIPRGLLARAAFRRAVGEWEGAARDLDEAKEIAEPAPMRLHLCDCALERARVALARREGFAPLNGFVEPSPPPPVLPDPDAAAALREEARKQLDVARKLSAPSPRRRTCRTRRRHRRRPPLRRPAASRLRRGKRTQLFA
jgi:tetratricopeptide (TPR) repeat protein